MPIKLEIVTVERMLYSDDVDMVIAPGTEGVMGILPNHAALLTALNYGELIVRKKGEDDQSFAIGGGFMEVLPNKVTVLADVAEHADDINIQRAQQARDRAKNLIESGNLSMDDMVRAEAAIRRALVRIKVAQKRRKQRPMSQD